MLATKTPTKQEVAAKLRQYDEMRAEFRQLERELKRECTEYGVSIGIWGFTPDHLRIQLEQERGTK